LMLLEQNSMHNCQIKVFTKPFIINWYPIETYDTMQSQ
jgi:hypothetical protein